MQAEIVLRQITGAAPHFGELHNSAGGDRNPRADSCLVTLSSDQFEEHSMIRGSGPVEKQSGRLTNVQHQDVNLAVVVKVTECGFAPRAGRYFVESGERGHVFEGAVAIVAIQKHRLLVPRGAFYVVHLRIDVAVHFKNIEPAVIDEVDKASAPPHQRSRGFGDASLPSNVGKPLFALIPVKRIRLVHEIRDKNIQPAIMVKIPEVNAHRALLLAIEAERRA